MYSFPAGITPLGQIRRQHELYPHTVEGGLAVKKDGSLPQNEQTRFTMRIDSRLLDRIKIEAQRNKRSTAKEIEFILERYMASLSAE